MCTRCLESSTLSSSVIVFFSHSDYFQCVIQSLIFYYNKEAISKEIWEPEPWPSSLYFHSPSPLRPRRRPPSMSLCLRTRGDQGVRTRRRPSRPCSRPPPSPPRSTSRFTQSRTTRTMARTPVLARSFRHHGAARATSSRHVSSRPVDASAGASARPRGV